MGMGEPLLNLDNVMPALRLMLDDNAYGLSRRRVTRLDGRHRADDRPAARRVPGRARGERCTRPNDALRSRLVPVNEKYPLRRAARGLPPLSRAAPRDFITFEYVMLDGVNDSDAHARELVGLVRRGALQVQPHPVQSVPESGFTRSGPDVIRRFAEACSRPAS